MRRGLRRITGRDGFLLATIVPLCGCGGAATTSHSSHLKSGAAPTRSTTQPASTTTTAVVPTTPSTSAPISSTLPNGTYREGTSTQTTFPGYFISLLTRTDGTVTGSVDFSYEDGQTSVVFTFTGTGQDGVLTLMPNSVPQNGSAAQNPNSVPSAIAATYGGGSINLGECTQYLHFAMSNADCLFTPNPAFGS